MDPEIQSPCLKICSLDKEKRYCTACLRTLQEIVRWPAASREERKEVLERIRKRRESGDGLNP